jgi:hypothetical protein
MGEYRLPIRLILGGAVITGLSVWFFLTVRDKELEELHNVGFALLIAGLGAIVVGIVLWPRSKKKIVPPPSDEPTAPGSRASEG